MTLSGRHRSGNCERRSCCLQRKQTVNSTLFLLGNPTDVKDRLVWLAGCGDGPATSENLQCCHMETEGFGTFIKYCWCSLQSVLHRQDTQINPLIEAAKRIPLVKTEASKVYKGTIQHLLHAGLFTFMQDMYPSPSQQETAQ